MTVTVTVTVTVRVGELRESLETKSYPKGLTTTLLWIPSTKKILSSKVSANKKKIRSD